MNTQPELRIALVNMPFASLLMPSLALAQIDELMKRRFGDRLAVSTHYLNLDMAHYVGLENYNHAILGAGYMTGIGDWFFRQVAFPEAEDNAEAYFDRFYFADNEESRRIREVYGEKRAGLTDFLDGLIEQYGLADMDVVGFTTLFAQAAGSFALAKRLKERNPDIITVMGGAAMDGVLGQTFAREVEQIDYVVSGPGLISFSSFVECLLAGDREGCEKIEGVLSRANQDQWCRKAGDGGTVPVLGQDLDINENLIPDYDSFLDDMDRHFPERTFQPVLLFETSRGCWWAEKSVCTFCGLNGMRQTQHWMTPANAIKHIEALFAYVPRTPSFIGVDTIVPPDYVKDVFPKLEAPPEMNILYELRVVLSDEELVVMNKAGVKAFQPGIEALSTSTLRLMAKGTTVFQNLKFLKTCAKHSVSLDWNLLIYSPGEEEAVYEKYQEDLPKLLHLAPPSGVYPIGFVRYSKYFDLADTYQLELKPQDYYPLTYPFGEEAVRDISYHFVDVNADTERMDFWLETLNQRVVEWQARWVGKDGKPQALLSFTQDGDDWAVYDSRQGLEIETPISPRTKAVLDTLEKPTTVGVIEKTFGGNNGWSAQEEIDKLMERGWLFEENGRFFNLVTTP